MSSSFQYMLFFAAIPYLIAGQPGKVVQDKNWVKKNIGVDGIFLNYLSTPKITFVHGTPHLIRNPSEGEKLFIKVKHSSNKESVFPGGLSRMSHGDPRVYYWTATIPEDYWVSYRLIYEGKDVGGESFVGLSDGLDAAPERLIFSTEGGMLMWNLPVRPNQGFHIWLIDDNGFDALQNRQGSALQK